MKCLAMICLAIAASSPTVAGTATRTDDRTLEYRCGELAIVGRVQSHAYESIADDTDFIGHGRIRATIKVRRIVRGGKLPSVISAEYFAHTYMRSDRDFMLIVRERRDGSYEIVTGQLMSLRPRLPPACL
jgi:hypothetical protein